MTPISQAEVDSKLLELTKPEYSTIEGLMNFVRSLSVEDPPGTAANARTFTYSGSVKRC